MNYDPALHYNLLRDEIEKQQKYFIDSWRCHDYSAFTLLDPKTWQLVKPANLPQRWEDIIASLYFNSIAFYDNSGDDCIDPLGNTMEVKLAMLDSSKCSIKPNGSLQYNNTTLEAGLAARFSVYETTNENHHNKDTGFVIFSSDLWSIIDAWIMPGFKVSELLHKSKSSNITRKISLRMFMDHGYKCSSPLPHIGWEKFKANLHEYTLYNCGYCDTPDHQVSAVEKFISMAKIENQIKIS